MYLNSRNAMKIVWVKYSQIGYLAGATAPIWRFGGRHGTNFGYFWLSGRNFGNFFRESTMYLTLRIAIKVVWIINSQIGYLAGATASAMAPFWLFLVLKPQFWQLLAENDSER